MRTGTRASCASAGSWRLSGSAIEKVRISIREVRAICFFVQLVALRQGVHIGGALGIALNTRLPIFFNARLRTLEVRGRVVAYLKLNAELDSRSRTAEDRETQTCSPACRRQDNRTRNKCTEEEGRHIFLVPVQAWLRAVQAWIHGFVHVWRV